jgi:hypothetical protein
MSGELWREEWGVAVESVYGTAVPATRKVYVMDPSLTRERASRPKRFAVGSRDNVRAHTLGPVVVGGSARIDMSADELLEWLLVTVNGGVTPTTPTGANLARLWTFTPGETLDSMTIERDDGARLRKAAGIRGNGMQISGNVRDEASVTFDLFGKELDALGSAASLSDRTPTYMDGWQVNAYIDNFGGTPGSTQVSDAVINWDIGFNNQMGRKYFANNSLALQAVTMGELELTASFLIEAAASAALAEYTNWDSQVKRIVRLEFLGLANDIEAATNEVQSVVLTGSPTGGTFTLTFMGQTTAGVAYDANAAAVQSALEALSTIGSGNVACAGGPLPGTAVSVTFQGTLAATNVAIMTGSGASLTGGSSPDVSITTTTSGSAAARRTVTVDIPGSWAAADLGQVDEGTRAYMFTLAPVYDPALAAMFRMRLINARTAAWV